MPTEKDERTERLRANVNQHEGLCETHFADIGLTTLSFQSNILLERHVWIDTDLSGKVKIDLEDWNFEETWDNSVATLWPKDLSTCAMIAIKWLGGGTLNECQELCK